MPLKPDGVIKRSGDFGPFEVTFHLTEEQSVRLFVQRRAGNTFYAQAASGFAEESTQVPTTIEAPKIPSPPLKLTPAPPSLPKEISKKSAVGPRFFSHNARSNTAHYRNGSTSSSVDRLLREVSNDLRSRGVDREPLDWSLVKPLKESKGSAFRKKASPRKGDDRFRGSDE